ncbi:MAG: hypothetical protein LBO06_05915 [Bacteroidales bacterium]|jgi:3-phosphoshikimate 1-carboxyvinyltransferase|nr:hypothetical protein [Bacteroidales bacterium]
MSRLVFTTDHLPDTIHFCVPLSKSISNRLLLINHLQSRNSTPIPLTNLSDSDDTKLIEQSLQTIRSTTTATFDFKNSGTSFRFLLALLAVTKGHWTLTASPRMELREIKPLVDVLNNLGASIVSASDERLLPLIVEGKSSLSTHNTPILLSAQPSSQIISSLLLIEKFIHHFSLSLSPNQSSVPYITMTKALIANPNVEVERCWSSAAFAYSLISLRQRGSVIIPQLSEQSIQGDSVCKHLFRAFGVQTNFTKDAAVLTFNPSIVTTSSLEIDILPIPDLFLPLAVTAAHFDVRTTFFNVSNLRFKESDRLSVAIKLLNNLGIDTTATANSLTIYGKSQHITANVPIISTFGDHRVAMSFSILAFSHPSVIIDDPECVTKSFANFWSNFDITFE